MSPATIITIIKSILCQPELKTWLERQAAISNTPIDDMALKIIYTVLGCKKEE